MAEKESGEDILRAILEKGNKNVKDQVIKILGEQPAVPKSTTKPRRKKLGEIVGRVGKTNFFRTADGSIVDDKGENVSARLAKAFSKYKPTEPAATGKPLKTVERELRRSIQHTNNIIKAQEVINKKMPIAHEHILKIVDKMSKQNEIIVASFIQQNQDMQDKLIEAMTGVKAPTRAGGAQRRVSRGVGASRAAARRSFANAAERAKYVRERAERIADVRMKRNIAVAAGAGIVGAGVGALAAAAVTGLGQTPPPPATPAPGPDVTTSSYTGTNDQIMRTIRQKESGGKYQVLNYAWPKSTASGAYQFIGSTWKSLTSKYGIGTEYQYAYQAPPEIQDAVADRYISDILKMPAVNGDVSKVPLVWYTGNPQGQISASAKALNRGLDPAKYQADWLKEFERQGGQKSQGPAVAAAGAATATAAATTQQTPRAPAGTGAVSSSGGATTTGAPQQVPGPSGPSSSVSAAATAASVPPGTPIGKATEQSPIGTGDVGNVKMTNQGAIRNQPITPYLMNAISTAIRDVYGAGARAEVYSGGQPAWSPYARDRTGSTRHDNGMAADVYVYVGGRKVMGDDLARLAQYWAARKLGGVGIEMRGGGIHLDQHTNRHPFWFYNGGESARARAMVMAGVQGQMPSDTGQTMIAEAPGVPAPSSAGGAPRQYGMLGPTSRAAEIRDMREAYAAQRPIIIDNNVTNMNQIIYRNSHPLGQRDVEFNPFAMALGFGIGKALRLF